MKRFNLVFAAAVAATLLLSACSIDIIPPGPPTPDVTRSVDGGSPTTPTWSGTVAAGSGVVFKLTVPSSQAGVVFLELDRNLNLELRNPFDYSVVASSSSPAFYARNTLGLAAAGAAGLDAQAIGVATACRGSCILLPGGSATYFARVQNPTNTSVAVNVYFFRDAEQDTNEPNDTQASATFFDVLSADGDQGAIELLGDVDYFRMSGPATIAFSTAAGNPVRLRLAVVRPSGGDETWIDGQGSINVFANDVVRVFSPAGRAGAPASSQYTLLAQH